MADAVAAVVASSSSKNALSGVVVRIQLDSNCQKILYMECSGVTTTSTGFAKGIGTNYTTVSDAQKAAIVAALAFAIKDLQAQMG